LSKKTEEKQIDPSSDPRLDSAWRELFMEKVKYHQEPCEESEGGRHHQKVSAEVLLHISGGGNPEEENQENVGHCKSVQEQRMLESCQ
jgi:hypothetical protein